MKKLCSAKVKRWFQDIQDYNFEIEYATGSSNVLADILSRFPVENSVEVKIKKVFVCSLSPSFQDSVHKILAVDYAPVSENVAIRLPERPLDYLALISLAQEHSLSGHFSVNRTARNLKVYIYWPELEEACLPCEPNHRNVAV